MDVRLSRDADALICLLYKNFLDKRGQGVSKGKAMMFGSSEDIHRNLTPKLSLQDTGSTCLELHKAELLNCFSADSVAYFVQLTDNGIVYMENRFKDGLKSVLDYLGSIKGAIPFV